VRRLLALAPFFVAGVIVASVVAGPKPGFCESRPSHPKCQTTTAPSTSSPPTVTTTHPPPTTVPPPTTTTQPPPLTGEVRANLWVVP
jgi:hypothetical protein